MTTTNYKGFGCEAVLDTAAGTVTLTHSGMTVLKHKKESSPWVIPLGAITDVEVRDKTALVRGHVRFILADRVGWAKDVVEDVNAFMTGKDKVGDFVAAVNAARASAAPTTISTGPAQSTRARLEAKSDELRARAAETQQLIRDNPQFQGIVVRGDVIEFNRQTFPLAGARATVEIGSTQRRTTATRVVVGSVITLGVGTVIGAMAKKKTSNVYVTVELADGQVIVVEADSKAEGKAREFAAALTSTAARAASNVASPSAEPAIDVEFTEALPAAAAPSIAPPPPPPPSVPANWYPDPDNADLLRYWDGSAWTAHTAPRPPQ